MEIDRNLEWWVWLKLLEYLKIKMIIHKLIHEMIDKLKTVNASS